MIKGWNRGVYLNSCAISARTSPFILNYMVTSNHIHLSREARDFASSTCVDDGSRDVIPKSIQLVKKPTRDTS